MRAGRVKALFAALLLIVSVVPFLALSTGASAAPTTPARSAQSDMAGFPLWYQDANGVRVQPCFDPNDVNCVAPISATYDATQPLAFPGNYPDEFFYSAVASQPIVVADCAVGNAAANPGVVVNLALEASFLNGTITPGDQMVFGRIRIVAKAGSGLCANTWYTFGTPYGPATIQTDANGAISGAVASLNTYDVGCLPGPTAPCNFDTVLGAPVLSVGLLRQVNNAAPGYLGSGIGFDAVTGGLGGVNQVDILKWPDGVTPPATGLGAACDASCTLLGSTDQFSVAAKLAGPLSASVTTLDFGGQTQGIASADRMVTLTNLGSGPLGLDSTIIDGFSVTGPDAADFFVHSTSCPVTGTPLEAAMPRDAACDVGISFTPSTAAAESATLVVSLNGGTQTLSLPLAGNGLLAGQAPAITVDPVDGNLALGAVRLTTASAVGTVTVTNSGTAPLLVQPAVNGADAAAFAIVTNNCSATYLAVGASCALGVKFTPTQVRTYSALLDIATNAATGTFVVALSGNGTGGVAAVGPVNPVNTQPDWYQDEHGVRVGQCDDPSNPLCITALPSGTAVFPTNYPSEWFYYIAQSNPIDVQDAACGVTAKKMFVTAAVESAFLGTIAAGQGTTFGRLRIVSQGGLCPNSQYLITHPYGQTTLTTDDSGLIKPHAGTTDVGCLGAPCDFSIALSAPEFESFLEQTAHPAGYLGDPLAPTTVVGAPFTDPMTGLPANVFRVQLLTAAGLPGEVIGGTDQFTVSGRLVGPMVATPAANDFGAIEVGLSSAAVTKTITFTNTGIATVNLEATPLTIDGAQAADFTLGATTCTSAMSLAPGGSCTADVTFAPLHTGARNAALTLHHDGKNNPLAASLTGVGNSAAGTAAISSNLSTVTFTDLHVGAKSASVDLAISNLGGSSALVVGDPSITAGQPFAITANTCTGTVDTPIFVQPNASCTISVDFVPASAGAFAATLTIPSNAASGTLTVALTGKGVEATPAVSAATTTAGFPIWVQDGNGVRLEQCLSQADQNCVLLPNTGFDPAQPIVWPTNYPVESFYSLADSELVTIPAQACVGGGTSAGGFGMVRLATEATFTTPSAAAGAQTLFNRIRITANGLCPSTAYTFVHPYGATTVTTDGAGDIKAARNAGGTFDNPNVTASTPISPAVLRWDPNVSAPPVGYLGDARTFHKVVGSQYSLTPNGEPVNFFRIVAPGGATIGQTDKFIVAGRVAGPVAANPASKDFGSVQQGAASATQTFTVSNISTGPIDSFTVTSSDPTLFSVIATTCSAAPVASDASCQVQVSFTPAAATPVGAKTGTITVGYNGLRSPLTIPVTGTVIQAGTPGMTVSPTSLAFGSIAVGASSTSQNVSVKNTGNVPMVIQGVLGGTNPTQYAVTATTCPAGGLAVGSTCTVSVAFRPTSIGSKPATVTIRALDTVSGAQLLASNVSLSGTGAQGTISLSATTLAIAGSAGRVSTGKLTLTNTGTAPWSLTGAPFYSFTAVSANNPVPKFSASQTGCNNVAPGKNCTVTVSFTVPAGTPKNTVYSVDMSMTSNASNNPVKVRVNGTVK